MYLQLSASDDADLRGVAQFALTSRVSHTSDLNPYRDRSLRMREAAGWTQPTTGLGD
ncbi:hypothetical protein [Cellulomonas composti]|uniref:hypothetical protein n=1 Tax=Cellulomonas composti TaxID=266130 RepID=UPI001649D7B6|nr:hypothetical protein [Cellulomonas composti]